MAVVIKDVQKHSPAEKYGIKAENGDLNNENK